MKNLNHLFSFSIVRSILVGLLLTAVSPAWSIEPGKALTSPEFSCAEYEEMGTPFKICIYHEAAERKTLSAVFKESFNKLRVINDWMSEWQPGTQLSQVNAAAGQHPVRVGKELYELMKFVMKVSENTGGAFDPTFNAFWGLYSFKPGQEREPTDAEIKERLPLINYKNVVLDDKNQTIFLKKPGMKLGLGGIGQGYGVDAVVAELKKKFPAGYVDGSGDTYFWGKKPNGALWVTGVRDPRDKDKVIMRIYGTDFAITTSGDDEKFFVKDGRRVHHIIDPKTGRSATAARQVTLITKMAVDSDAYDTGVLVMGPDKGKAVIEKLGYRGIFVTDKEVTLTSGLKKRNTPWGEVWEVEGALH